MKMIGIDRIRTPAFMALICRRPRAIKRSRLMPARTSSATHASNPSHTAGRVISPSTFKEEIRAASQYLSLNSSSQRTKCMIFAPTPEVF
jgi:hypothetical protein